MEQCERCGERKAVHLVEQRNGADEELCDECYSDEQAFKIDRDYERFREFRNLCP